MPEPRQLTIGIPKGSLQEATLALFARAGLSFYGHERSLWIGSSDTEVKPVLLRPQEIPIYVAKGVLDCGLSGLDWITETKANDSVRILADLCYSKRSFRPVRWVLAVSEDSPWQSVSDLKEHKPPIRISTELREITQEWAAEKGLRIVVDFSWGATEAKPPVFADAIVDVTETGASLQANRLRILDTVFKSTTQFFANKKMYMSDNTDDRWKQTKLDGIALLLKSCLAADAKVDVRLQVPEAELAVVKALIPSNASFSVWNGGDGNMVVEVIIDKSKTRELIPVFARNGANRISVSALDMLYG